MIAIKSMYLSTYMYSTIEVQIFTYFPCIEPSEYLHTIHVFNYQSIYILSVYLAIRVSVWLKHPPSPTVWQLSDNYRRRKTVLLTEYSHSIHIFNYPSVYIVSMYSTTRVLINILFMYSTIIVFTYNYPCTWQSDDWWVLTCPR